MSTQKVLDALKTQKKIENYGVDSHYKAHFDFARKSEIDAFSCLGVGNRIDAWLIYLSDVEQGGATVFPVVSDHLKSKKEVLHFVYIINYFYLFRRLQYSSCRYFFSLIKWVDERGEEFRRPCVTRFNGMSESFIGTKLT
ncbi:unnamed protein product [Adineta steineri]|uniref:Uncharacterized protein n=1 Tax=Adineta steineri TaxID=433720 RepID=A0A815K067_9BILA|nr:unnamed protein product [Adineta steineri]CAF1389124.1 unnamed protein product [Adineta steineri]